MKRQNCTLIVDEAFHDFVLDYEPLAPLIQDYKSLILLRSLTKMFAIPGLRLGYAMAIVKSLPSLLIINPIGV